MQLSCARDDCRRVLFDRAPRQRARRAAQELAEDTRMAAVDDVAEDAARSTPDDEAGGAVVALAIIAAVLAGIDALVGAHHALLLLRARAIIARGIVTIGRA